jgi:hypothetical protein
MTPHRLAAAVAGDPARARAAALARYDFTARAVMTVTAEQLAAAGLSPEPLSGITVDLARVTASGKWHVPGGSSFDQCSHLQRYTGYGQNARELPIHQVALLGIYDVCAKCAGRFGPAGPAAAYWRAGLLIVRAAEWVADLETVATGLDWLGYARWNARTPFTSPDPLPDILSGLKGARGWSAARGQAQRTWSDLRERAEAAWSTARQSAGPPGLRTRAAAARDTLARDRDIRDEGRLIEAIAGLGHPGFYGPDTWSMAADAWVVAVAADGRMSAGRAAMGEAVERAYRKSTVRDVSLLPSPAATPGADYCSPAHWARAEFQLLRRAVTTGWADRLEQAVTALLDSATATAPDRLLLITGLPMLSAEAADVAYLTQYPHVASGPQLGAPDRYRHRPATAAVLRVPAFAADHALAAGAKLGAHSFRTGPDQPVATTDLAAAYALLRRASIFVPEETFADPDPDVPHPQVAACREPLRSHCMVDFAAWSTTGAKPYDLHHSWRWVPDDPAGPPAGGSVDILEELCRAFAYHEVDLTLLAGPYPAPEPVTVRAYLDRVDRQGQYVHYRVDQPVTSPTVRVPLRRLISMSLAR